MLVLFVGVDILKVLDIQHRVQHQLLVKDSILLWNEIVYFGNLAEADSKGIDQPISQGMAQVGNLPYIPHPRQHNSILDFPVAGLEFVEEVLPYVLPEQMVTVSVVLDEHGVEYLPLQHRGAGGARYAQTLEVRLDFLDLVPLVGEVGVGAPHVYDTLFHDLFQLPLVVHVRPETLVQLVYQLHIPEDITGVEFLLVHEGDLFEQQGVLDVEIVGLPFQLFGMQILKMVDIHVEAADVLGFRVEHQRTQIGNERNNIWVAPEVQFLVAEDLPDSLLLGSE